MGLIALPAAAALRGTADAAGGPVAHQLSVSTVGTRQEAGDEPEQTYRWDKTGFVQPSSAPLPDERSSPRQTIVRIAQAALMIGLIGLGLGITFTSLLSDIKRRRRVVYRPRGP
jgi:hypothetical protein